MGQLARDLGNIYRICSKPIPNGSPFFWSLFGTPQHRPRFEHVTPAEYQAAQARARELLARLSSHQMSHPDANLIADEFRFAADLLIHACQRAQHQQDPTTSAPANPDALIAQHEKLWLARNRPGGLTDSTARLQATRFA